MVKSLKHLKKMQSTRIARSLLFLLLLIAVIVVLLGSTFNYLGYKYLRVIPDTDIKSGACQKRVLISQVEDSIICCEKDATKHDWICIAAFDSFNRILTTYYAFMIPLIPLLLTTVIELYFYFHQSKRNLKKEESSSHRNYVTGINLTAHILRLILYGSIFVFRTTFLYMLGDAIQRMLQKIEHINSCWYVDIVKGNSCHEIFDFSDHIVLYMLHYILPAALELAYVIIRISVDKLSSIAGLVKYVMPIIASIVICLVSLRSILFTCMFFHTPLENFVGLLIASFGGFLPILLLLSKPCWAACVYGSTKS